MCDAIVLCQDDEDGAHWDPHGALQPGGADGSAVLGVATLSVAELLGLDAAVRKPPTLTILSLLFSLYTLPSGPRHRAVYDMCRRLFFRTRSHGKERTQHGKALQTGTSWYLTWHLACAIRRQPTQERDLELLQGVSESSLTGFLLGPAALAI